MTQHAHEDDDGERTLCGQRRDAVSLSNAFPTCKTCIRVIRSRCETHNAARCRLCSTRIGA